MKQSWKKRKNIYLRTYVPLALSLTATIISMTQCINSKLQNQIATLQATIAETQLMPQFDISIKSEPTGNDGFHDKAFLTVTNNGGPVYEFHAKTAYYIKIKAVGKSAPIKTAEIRFPVDGYFGIQAKSSASHGTLATFFDIDNHRRHFNLAKGIREHPEAHGLSSAYSEEEFYLSIHYVDALKRVHNEYYQVYFVDGAVMLQNEVGENIFKEAKYPNTRELSKLKSDELLDEIAKKL